MRLSSVVGNRSPTHGRKAARLASEPRQKPRDSRARRARLAAIRSYGAAAPPNRQTGRRAEAGS